MTSSDVTGPRDSPAKASGTTEPAESTDIVPSAGSPAPAPVVKVTPARPPFAAPTRDAPLRPALYNKEGMPVLVKMPPPASVRLAMVCWILSLIAGAAGAAYLFIIRIPQLPEIADVFRDVEPDRADETYELAADIVFWSVFGVLVAVLLIQITLLVAFSNRRPRMRWWIFGSTILLGIVFVLSREIIMVTERGVPLERILLIQLALLVLGILLSILPGALRWTARKHDVRRGSELSSGGEF